MKLLRKLRASWIDLFRGKGSWKERIERNETLVLFLVLAFATILRLLFLSHFYEELYTRREKGFWYPAWNFVHGKGMGIAEFCPSSYRAPLYIIFMMPFFALFGWQYAIPLGLAQVAVSVANVYLVFRIGKEWRSSSVGLLGAFFMAVYPYILYHDTQNYITFLFTFFLLLSILYYLRLERVPSVARATFLGIWLGLAMLATSGPIVFLAPLASFWLLRRWKNLKKTVGYVTVTAMTVLIVMSPWVVRNWRVHHTFIPLTTDAGRVFYKAYHPLSMQMMLRGEWVDLTPEPEGGGPASPMGGVRKIGCDFMNGVSAIESSHFYGKFAKEWVSQHPVKTAVLVGMKFNYLWRPWLFPPKGALGGNGATILSYAFMNWGYALSYGFLLLFSAFEVVASSKKERRRTWLFLLTAIAFTLTYTITVAGTKYRIPFDSIMAVMTASGVLRLTDAFNAWKTRKPHE